MFNIHIGVPRVGADLLHTLAESATNEGSNFMHILPKSSFREKFRSLVNQPQSGREGSIRRHEAQTMIQSLTWYNTVAISQHALLGTPQDFIASPKDFTRAATRVARLSALFEEHPLTFHLMITSQVDYIVDAFGAEAKAVISTQAMPSWLNLVSYLKSAAPERNFVVWDFERPRSVTIAFITAMLGTAESGFIEDARNIIRENSCLLERKTDYSNLNGIEDLLARYDEEYDLDLIAISEMDGVSLIGPDTESNDW